MGLLRNFFSRREDFDDYNRKYTTIMHEDWITTLILVVPINSGLPKDDNVLKGFVRKLYQTVNPYMYEAIKDRAYIKTFLCETAYMGEDGFIEEDFMFDSLDDCKVPPAHSAYLQALHIEDEKITIRLKHAKKPIEEYTIGLKYPIKIKDKDAPEDVLLLTVFESSKPRLTSSVFPTRPKSRPVLEKD